MKTFLALLRLMDYDWKKAQELFDSLTPTQLAFLDYFLKAEQKAKEAQEKMYKKMRRV